MAQLELSINPPKKTKVRVVKDIAMLTGIWLLTVAFIVALAWVGHQ